MLNVARVGNTPGTEVLLGREGPAIHRGVAIVTTNRQAAVIELPDIAQVNFVDLVLHVCGVAPLNLRTQITYVQNAIAVSAHGIVNCVGLDWRTATVINRVLKDNRCTHRHEGRRVTQRVVATGFGLRAVRVEDQRATIREFPLSIEAEGVQLVLDRTIGLLKADVLGTIVVFLKEHSAGNRAIIVKNDLIERRGEPVCLLVTKLFCFRFRKGVITRQCQIVDRTELQDQLAVDPLTGNFREVVAAILRNGVKLAILRRVGDLRGAVTPDIAGIFKRSVNCRVEDQPVIDLLGRCRGIALGVRTKDADTKPIRIVGPACEAGKLWREIITRFNTRIVDCLGRERSVQTWIVKWRPCLDVDGRAEAT